MTTKSEPYGTINCPPLVLSTFLVWIINQTTRTILGTRELLSYLEKLEIGLSSFSYEELGTVEAGELKKSFEVFKNGLEDKVFGASELKQLEGIYKKVGIQVSDGNPADHQEKPNAPLDAMSLINALENTPLNKAQRDLLKALRKLVQKPKENGSGHLQTNKKTMSPYFESIEKNLEPDFSHHQIGLKSVLEECMGQMHLMEELVRMFRQNILEFIGSAYVHLKNEDHDALDLACQKVIPNLRTMKTYGLLETAQQMAILCRTDKDMKHLTFLYDQFLTEFPSAEEQVDFEMEVLRTM